MPQAVCGLRAFIPLLTDFRLPAEERGVKLDRRRRIARHQLAAEEIAHLANELWRRVDRLPTRESTEPINQARSIPARETAA